MRISSGALIESATRLERMLHDSGADAPDFAPSDHTLIGLQKEYAAHLRVAETQAALVAAEIARRSDHQFGHSGLSAVHGFRTPQQFIQNLTGLSGREANQLIRVGERVAETLAVDEFATVDGAEDAATTGTEAAGAEADAADAADAADSLGAEAQPAWDAPVSRAVAAGVIGLGQADAILRGLGSPEGLDADQFACVLGKLLDAAPELPADELFKRARLERDLLDVEGIPGCEEKRRERRSLRTWRRPDGMTALFALLDPLSAETVVPALQTLTSPRRGGPRFVDAHAVREARKVIDDSRTDEQIWLDGLVSMVRIATEADPGTLFGPSRPTVRIMVTADDLSTLGGSNMGRGFGVMDGQTDPISLPTVETELCGGYQLVGFDDDGQCINVGRERRFFTKWQRDGLAARDGGCMGPGCDRPASWCEAHHLQQWKHGGKTDLADGILLCRWCHIQLHALRARIIRKDARYYWRPRGAPDDGSADIPLHSRNRLMNRLTG